MCVYIYVYIMYIHIDYTSCVSYDIVLCPLPYAKSQASLRAKHPLDIMHSIHAHCGNHTCMPIFVACPIVDNACFQLM